MLKFIHNLIFKSCTKCVHETKTWKDEPCVNCHKFKNYVKLVSK